MGKDNAALYMVGSGIEEEVYAAGNHTSSVLFMLWLDLWLALP